jgi:hypothetical protein
VEECTYFWGVNTSWGINTAESKRPLNQEDNQAPQPTEMERSSKIEIINLMGKVLSYGSSRWKICWWKKINISLWIQVLHL